MAKRLVSPEAEPPVSAGAVFEHAECFYRTFAALSQLNPDPRVDLHTVVTLAEPLIVLAAFTNELFLKCLICIETGGTPRSHDLRALFGKLSEGTRTKIQDMWDHEVAVRRRKDWDDWERFGLQIPRDLPSALLKGSDAFERYRYSYEGNTQGLHHYLEDLPALLEKIILEMRPEFEGYRRAAVPLPGQSFH